MCCYIVRKCYLCKNKQTLMNYLLKTKTLKLNSSPFTKVKMRLKVIEIDFDFYIDKESKGGFIYMNNFVDNKHIISSILKKDYDLSNDDIETIINFLSTIYNLDLSKKNI